MKPRPSSSTLVCVGLLAGALAGPARATDVDRTRQPPPGADTSWAPPTPATFSTLGLKGLLVERHDLPVVELMLAWDVGAASDPPGKEGLHGLCADLMDEATTSLAQSALQDAKADLGATISTSSRAEQSTLSARVARARLPETLDLVAQILLNPALAPADLERLRGQYKAAILQQRGNADGAARRVLGPVAWGAAHPLGRIATEQSIDAITRQDCVRMAATWRPRGAQLLVVGDVTTTELGAMLTARLGTWKGDAPRAARLPASSSMGDALYFVDVPGAAQSRIIVAHDGPARRDAAYHANTLMTQVLGAGLPSRLVQNLRERNGYTYGAQAGLDYTRASSQLVVSTSVRTDVTVAALREIVAELRGMTARPVEDHEVAREREGGLRAFPNRFASGTSTLDALASLTFHGLPLDTWRTTPAELGRVATDDVRGAARRHIKPARAAVIIAGDRTKVWADLAKLSEEKLLGQGGLVELDADGRKVTRHGAQ